MIEVCDLTPVGNEKIIQVVEELAQKEGIGFDTAARTLTRFIEKQKKQKTEKPSTSLLIHSDSELLDVPEIAKPGFTTTRSLTPPAGAGLAMPVAEERVPDHLLNSEVKVWHGGHTGREPDAVQAPHKKPSWLGTVEQRKISRIKDGCTTQANAIFGYLRKVAGGQDVPGGAINFISNLSNFLWTKPISYFEFEKEKRLDETLLDTTWAPGVDERVKEISIRGICTDPDYRSKVLRNSEFVRVEEDGKVTGLLGEAVRTARDNGIEGAERTYQHRVADNIRRALKVCTPVG
jgi:hypothetical protein